MSIIKVATKTGGGGKPQPYSTKNGEILHQKTTLKSIGNALKGNNAKQRNSNVSVSKREWRAWYDAIGEIKLGVRYELF